MTENSCEVLSCFRPRSVGNFGKSSEEFGRSSEEIGRSSEEFGKGRGSRLFVVFSALERCKIWDVGPRKNWRRRVPLSRDTSVTSRMFKPGGFFTPATIQMESIIVSPYAALAGYLDRNPDLYRTSEGRRLLIDTARKADDEGALSDRKSVV